MPVWKNITLNTFIFSFKIVSEVFWTRFEARHHQIPDIYTASPSAWTAHIQNLQYITWAANEPEIQILQQL